MNSDKANQIRLWPENVAFLEAIGKDTKLSLTYLANMTIRAAAQQQQAKEKQRKK